MWNCGEKLQMVLRTWLYFLDKKPWADHLLSPASVWLWNKWESCLFSPTGFIKQSKHCHKNKRCCAWESGKGDGNFPKDSIVVLKLLLAKIDRKKMKIILLKFLLLNMKPSDWKLWWWYLLNRKVLWIKNEPPTRDRRNERALQRTFRSVVLSLVWALHGQMWSEVHCISVKNCGTGNSASNFRCNSFTTANMLQQRTGMGVGGGHGELGISMWP